MEFQVSHFLWLVFSLLLGTGYAALLYSKTRPGAAVPRYVLFALRALCISIISFLLFAPQFRSQKKTLEKPVIILAQDNSASLTLGPLNAVRSRQYSTSLKDFYDRLSEKYQVDTLFLGDSVRAGFHSDLRDRSTNISSLFRGIRDLYAGRNVGAVILASDGLYNRGGDPLSVALSLKAPVYSLALGDTNVRKDLSITNVNYNELVQAGSDFEIDLQIEAYQSKGETPKLTIYRGRELLYSKVLNISSNDFHLTHPVILPGQPSGIFRYTVRIESISKEISNSNNVRDFYVQAQDARKKILIVADAPHPDISAIRQSLGSVGSFELNVSYADDLEGSEMEKADLIILYQLPSRRQQLKAFAGIIKAKPIFYVLGSQSDIAAFSSMQEILDLKPALASVEAKASLNTSFPVFSISDSLASQVQRYGPLLVPFSDVRFKGGHYELLYQDVGKFKTGRPLFSFSANTEPRVAVLGAEGIWRWRLEAFNTSGSHNLIDQLLSKTVQYLVANSDRRRFRVYASQQSYTDSEPVILNAELYNETLELVNQPDVSLTLRGTGSRVYSYQFSRLKNSYTLNMETLPPGEYYYKASTKLGNTTHTAEGMVLVSSNKLEFQEVRANHQLLYQLASQSGGDLFYPEQLEELERAIKTNEMVKTVSYENAIVSDIVAHEWLLGLICGLLFCEWLLRKRSGEL